MTTTETEERTAAQIKRDDKATRPRARTNAEEGAKRRGVLERWKAGEVTPSKLNARHLPYSPIKVAAVGIDQGQDVSTAVLVASDFITLKGNQVAAGLHRAETQLAGLESAHKTKLAIRALEFYDTDPEGWDLTNVELEAARDEVARWKELGGVVEEAKRLALQELRLCIGAESYAAKLARGWAKVVEYAPTDKTRYGTAEKGYETAEAAVSVIYSAYRQHLYANPATSIDKRVEGVLREMFNVAAVAVAARGEVGSMPTHAEAIAVINGPDSRAAEKLAEYRAAEAEKLARKSAEAVLNAKARNPQREAGDDG